MKTEDIEILQILEPTIKLRELKIGDFESKDKDGHLESPKPRDSQYYSMIPLVSVAGCNIIDGCISAFNLDLTGFMPTCSVTFLDVKNEFQSKYILIDGSVFSVFITPQSIDKIYKPIRLDFIATKVTCKNSGNLPERGSSSEFTISGILRIPKCLNKFNYSKHGTSFNTLMDLSSTLELGFSSNIESTNDDMIWLNTNSSLSDYVKSITDHAYIDDDNFIASFIDCYYNLNLVEVDRLFGQFGNKESKKMTVLSVIPNIANNDENNDSNGMTLYEDNYIITNHMRNEPWNNYIESYREINRAGSTLYNGYRKYVQYYDFKNNEFVSEYVDTLSHNTDGMIPVNKGQFYNEEPEDNLRNELASYTYFGIQDNDNQHEHYYWAGVQNEFNMSDCQKFGLEVTLQAYNPAITRCSRIWVDIYEKNELASERLKPKTDEEDPLGIDADVSPILNPEDDNTGQFWKDSMTFNQALSGFYVVMGMKIFLDQNEGILKEKLILNRREMIPANKHQVMTDKEIKNQKRV